MALFDWNDKYSVGVRELDSQHKVLVGLLNELYDAMNNGKSNEILGKIINKLVDYTKTHFATEERYMSTHGYPELASQKREHQMFTDKVIAFKNEFDSGKIALTVAITSFLKSWLSDHISGSDKKYGPFFNSKGIS
ncbi:MAG: bacteriohemerythrin [bacterium]